MESGAVVVTGSMLDQLKQTVHRQLLLVVFFVFLCLCSQCSEVKPSPELITHLSV